MLVYKATEMVNFAQGDLMMLGAFVAYTCAGPLGLPFLLAILATVLVMAVVGAVTERVLLRPMIGEPHFAVLMLTIGLGFILRAIAGAIWGNEPKALPTPYAGQLIELGGLILRYENLAVIIGTAVLCGLLFGFFRFTRVGIAMQAASQNQLAAFYVGIPVKRIYALVWALSAIISAVAGILIAPIALINPLMGLSVAIKAFAAAIVGGFGSLPGALLAGLLIGVAEQFAGFYLEPLAAGSAAVSPYIILLLVLVLRPEGLFATIQQKKV